MKTTDKQQEKRDKIILAAKSLFTRTHDVKRVSIEAIAAEAGVSPTTIYNHFGDRETLIFEIIKDLTSQNLERNRALIRSDLPFPQKLAGIISGKMAIAEKMNSEIIEKLISQDKKIVPFVDEIFEQKIKPLWKEMLADGKKQGYIEPAINDDALLAYLDIIQTGLRAKPDFMKQFPSNLDFIEQLARLFYFGFLKKDIDLFRKGEQ